MRKKGFTLIELLVVVALIGVLTTLLLANFSAARQRGRDAQRKSDLKNIATALRLYYNDEGGFPDSDTNGQILGCGPTATDPCGWGTSFTAGNQTYMSNLPDDPLSNVSYQYSQIDLDTFSLKACLENTSDDRGVDDPTATWCPTQYVYEVKP